jgi:predicted nucleotidyltransferase
MKDHLKNSGLSSEVIEKINLIFSKYDEIEKVILYGSRAKGTYKHSSDIDLSIVSSDLDLTKLLKIENELDDLLLPFKIDLSLKSKIDNQKLIDHIDRVGVIFYVKS